MNEPAEDLISCPQCKAPSPTRNRFCGECGARLDTKQSAVDEYLRVHLPAQVSTIVKQRFQDQKVIELETSERIAERSMKWAKIIAFFLGIPIVAFAALLSFLGVKTYGDLTELLEKTGKIAAELQIAQNQLSDTQEQTRTLTQDTKDLRETIETRAGAVLTTATALEREVAQARTRLAEIPELSQRQKNLEANLRAIEEQIGFQESAALTPELQSRLEDALERYLPYLNGVGFEERLDRVTVLVDPTVKSNAFYRAGDQTIIIGANIAEDIGVALREYTHHVLIRPEKINLLPHGDAIESALADYYPSSFSNDPRVGKIFAQAARLPRDYIRNLDNHRSFEEFATLSSADFHYAGAEIWGGAFWEIRKAIGQSAADRLLAIAWSRFSPTQGADEFIGHVLSLAQALEEVDDLAKIRGVFERRNFPL
jgi:hypothetical protein